MNTIAQRIALDMLRYRPERDIYEAGSPDGTTGCGRFFVSYSEGRSPELDQEDIDALVRGGVIRAKYPGCYVLTPP